jgi:hypothetical protein
LAGKSSPIYKDKEKQTYTLNIQRMIEGFRHEDPPAIPQLAVPVAVPNLCFEAAMKTSSPKEHAIGCLTLIAFYFLLRVGEYTQPKYVYWRGERIRATRTKQFTVGNVGFFKNGKIVKRSSSLAVLLQSDSATLKITNQKNGRMGETIHQEQVKDSPLCPVKALARRVHHILSNGGTKNTLLCTYFESGEEYTIRAPDIVTAVRKATMLLKLQDFAIDADLVGAHSLRAGGAMALRLHGYDSTTIMKMGRWTSTTFLEYIHTQIAHLSKGVSTKMSTNIAFTNIAAIDTG